MLFFCNANEAVIIVLADDGKGEKLMQSEELVTKLQEELSEKEDLLKSLEQHKDTLCEDAAMFRSKNEALTCDIDKYKAENDVMTAHIAECKSAYEDKIKDLTAELASSSEQLENLQK